MKPKIKRPRGDGGGTRPAEAKPPPRAARRDVPQASPAGGATAPVRAPSLLHMLLAVPLALGLYYVRWLILVRLGGLGGDRAARSRRWSRWERRFRPSPEGAVRNARGDLLGVDSVSGNGIIYPEATVTS
jgi:hypothetical protein